MLADGNKNIQETVYDYFMFNTESEKFFR